MFPPIASNADPLTATNGYNATLAFELAEDRHVTLYIYDASGKAVEAIQRPAIKGMNRITIEGRYLAAGTYSYILSDGREAVSSVRISYEHAPEPAEKRR